ncbi:MAG: FkbM family methyltransferase [Acidobacteria bacterium]|nr:FkbM family methyltransferase [Acidobacteriota bacterium]
MWIAEETVRALDRPEGRAELARLATDAARRASGDAEIEIVWDGMWMRRAEGILFPDPELLQTANPRWDRWSRMATKYLNDAEDYWYHVYKPQAGDVIVDIGAGRGEDVFAFSKSVGASGCVWAIEAHPVSFAVLTKFCEVNGLANVRRRNLACVEEAAQLHIETLPVWESNFVRGGEATATSHEVEGVTFDSLAESEGIGRIDFLKMNIEGAERTALPGCREALARTRHVCIAAHDFRAARGEGEEFRTLGFVREFLSGCGFELVTRDDDPRYYVPYHVHGRRA